MINIIFIIIILILIILYINKQKKEDFSITSSVNPIIKDYVYKNKIDLKAMRNLIEFIKYLYPDDKNFTIPADTFINSNINMENIIVETDCIIHDSIDVDNLTVDGNIYMLNKNNTYNIGDSSNNKNMILDIFPIGTIIPWMQTKSLPIGWKLCDGSTWLSDDEYTQIITPPLNKNDIQNANQTIDGRVIIGCALSGEIGQTGGADVININDSYLPIHNHNMILNFNTFEPCSSNDSKCKYTGFHFGTGSNLSKIGNTNSILSFSPMYSDSASINNTFSSKCVSYIIKVF